MSRVIKKKRRKAIISILTGTANILYKVMLRRQGRLTTTFRIGIGSSTEHTAVKKQLG